ncbi:hypothetical protein QBC46DRAFT_296550 [Diplogelasinospora grovesii]|uniref:Uncharacterized protein n=1 Tax=Diplogelasinospora grovesii TaxID=303347 RepID=A0AAN6S044_9PEZI|nr:hypothetical protein QBC46DRAFT_296550 [Diplogelasinospora grovesii]
MPKAGGEDQTQPVTCLDQPGPPTTALVTSAAGDVTRSHDKENENQLEFELYDEALVAVRNAAVAAARAAAFREPFANPASPASDVEPSRERRKRRYDNGTTSTSSESPDVGYLHAPDVDECYDDDVENIPPSLTPLSLCEAWQSPQPSNHSKKRCYHDASPCEHENDLLGRGRRKKHAASRGGWRRELFTFFHFPAEIRNMIYEYTLQYPNSRALYSGYNRVIEEYYARRCKQGGGDGHDTDEMEEEEFFPEFDGRLRCPTILLLCRTITSECLPMLQSQVFVIDRLPPWLPGDMRPMKISQFISNRTIQNLRNIEIRCPVGQGIGWGSGWVWADIVKEVIDILLDKNCFEHLRIVLSIWNRDNQTVWRDELRYMGIINKQIDAIKTQNPNIWKPGRIEREKWFVEPQKAFLAKEDEDDKDYLDFDWSKTKFYPDETIWPGCLLEFI